MEPICIANIDISRAGKNCKLLLGDINGDGRMELVCVQPDGGIDDRFVPHQVVCVTAYALTGECLWQTGTSTAQPGSAGSDYPAQVFDIDGDGQLEVLVVMNQIYKILDGTTGQVKREFPLKNLPVLPTSDPRFPAGTEAPHAHDCIIIANFCGNPTPRDVILKDRYENMWALNENFHLLWTYSGNIGHFPLACDLNGDGRDEVMAGYTLLSAEGKALWSCKDLEDHADCLWAGDVNGDGRPELCVGGSVTCLYDAEGNELWRYEGSIESQHIALGKFLPDSSGLQIAGLDRIRRGDGYKGQWDGKDGMFLLDSQGRELWKENRQTQGWLTIVETLPNWAGEGRDYILAYRRGGGVYPALYNGEMETVVAFPTDGYVVYGDLFGRNCTDVVIYAEETAWVYSGKPYDLSRTPSGKPVPQGEKQRRATLYPGCVYAWE